MAKVIKKPSALKEEYLHLKVRFKRAVLSLLALIGIAVLGNLIMQSDKLYSLGMILVGAAVLGFFICLGIIMSTQSSISIKGQGVLGEERALSQLAEGLDDSYTIIQNAVITLDGKSSEIDLIVVGLNGVFAIETKNRNGLIEGGYDRERWLQHKVGRRGGEYSAEFYSPVKQVGTHVFRLAGFLKQNGIRFYIMGAVYFSNPEARVRLSGEADKIPVFSSQSDLILYIKTNNASLPLETKQKIINLIK